MAVDVLESVSNPLDFLGVLEEVDVGEQRLEFWAYLGILSFWA